MRRQIIILITLLLFVLPVSAQEWPDSFIGDQMQYQEEQPIQMYLFSWHDRNPWGMIDMTGMFFYFGSLEFGYCDSENVVFFDLDRLAFRNCPDPVFGSPAPPQCYYYNTKPINLHYMLTWNEDAGAYLLDVSRYWGVDVVALVLDSFSDSGIILMGTMQLSEEGVMVWDDSITHYTYVFEPFTALPGPPPPRKSAGRRLRAR